MFLVTPRKKLSVFILLYKILCSPFLFIFCPNTQFPKDVSSCLFTIFYSYISFLRQASWLFCSNLVSSQCSTRFWCVRLFISIFAPGPVPSSLFHAFVSEPPSCIKGLTVGAAEWKPLESSPFIFFYTEFEIDCVLCLLILLETWGFCGFFLLLF